MTSKPTPARTKAARKTPSPRKPAKSPRATTPKPHHTHPSDGIKTKGRPRASKTETTPPTGSKTRKAPAGAEAIPRTKAQIQAKYIAGRQAAGHKRMCIMVPPHGVADFRKAVSTLRKKWDKREGVK